MKKWYLPVMVIILLLFGSTMYSSENEVQLNDEEQGDDIEIVFGVGIVNGEPKYMDPAYFEVPEVYMSREYLNNIDGDIIQAGILTFLGNSRLFVADVKKSRPNISLTERELKYKVENHTLYVSGNGTHWEPVKFKVINDQPHKNKYDPTITNYWVVYLECKWFKGEYEIWSIPNT